MGVSKTILAGFLGSTCILAGCATTPETTTDTMTRSELPAPKQRPAAIANGPDVAMPEVFEVTEAAVWDGRPSIGNVWVEVPAAMQPERVRITNGETGQVLTGAMFVARADMKRDAPIRLSSQAARALGLKPNEAITLTVTALRKRAPEPDAAPVVVAATQAPAPARQMPALSSEDLYMPAPQMVTDAPAIQPAPTEGDFIQVAEALSADSAERIQVELELSNVHSEIQEDYVDGLSVYRVFASRFTDREHLAGALDNIRFANNKQGSDDGTLIAEMPNFSALKSRDEPTPWMEVGTYNSRNEAMAVVQRLGRRAVPAEICDVSRGHRAVFRVFGGPAGDDATVSLDSASFCAGVAAAEFGPQFSDQATVSSHPMVPLPQTNDRELPLAVIPDGAVRIRVGEATGGLKLSVPNPYSEPITINAGGTIVTLPVDTDPARVREIVEALSKLGDSPEMAPLPQEVHAP